MLRLDELPVEMVAHVASYLGKRYVYKYPLATHDLSELLALRCASRSCKDAVRRAATQHKAVEKLSFQGSSAQSIAVRGRVFGSGCRELEIGDIQSAEAVNEIENLVTNGQLRSLICTGSIISMPALLEMCRACPLLEHLCANTAPITTANLEYFASAVSRACPLLESVLFPWFRSPMEDYQWHFQRLKCLSFSKHSTRASEPIRYDKIEATLRACVHADVIDIMEATVSPQLVDMILGAPAAGRIKALDLNGETLISPESILRVARGLEALEDLQLPNDFNGAGNFYSSLVQARPTLKRLSGFGNMLGDEDLLIICEDLRLEHLDLVYVDHVTDLAGFDIILESPCAQTLCSIDVSHTVQFTSACLLRLVRGCPRLAKLEWELSEDYFLSPIEDGPNIDAINALLDSRGGQGVTVLGNLLGEYGPWEPSYYG